MLMKTYSIIVLSSFWLFTTSHQSIQQSSQFLIEKRFSVVPEPAKNGLIMLRVKGHYGQKGGSGVMGDKGPPGSPGSPGIMGPQGSPGFCSAEMCDPGPDIQSLVSRVEKLEGLVKARELLREEMPGQPSPSNRPMMALHITSDILFSKGNTSRTTVPRNINLNIALKDNAKLDGKSDATMLPNAKKGGKFLVNSTVYLDTGSNGKSDIAIANAADNGEAMTERQFQRARTGQNEVPSIKKNKIPHQRKLWTKG